MENKDWLIITDKEWLTPFEFMRELGIEMLGLSIDDLLEVYFDEKESINENFNI
jgi:fatty acid-binding protein DegV